MNWKKNFNQRPVVVRRPKFFRNERGELVAVPGDQIEAFKKQHPEIELSSAPPPKKEDESNEVQTANP
jgi:hypothetical protein